MYEAYVGRSFHPGNGRRLNFITPYDSVFLQNTTGTFSLRDRLFVGDGGRFDWSAAGLPSDSVYYDLNKYTFKTTQPYLKAEQGKLRYIGKVAVLVPGIFEFRSINHKTPESSTYPRFKSYESNINLLGLGSDKLKYTGGLGLQGKAMNSNSADGSLAMIEISGDTDKKFKATAASFGFKDSVIVSSRAHITIYQQRRRARRHIGMQAKEAIEVHRRGRLAWRLHHQVAQCPTMDVIDNMHLRHAARPC